MKNKIICSLVVVFLLSMAVLPVSGALYILKEKEDIDEILNSGYEVKMFFIGRIDDLIIDEQQTSFYPVNVFIIAIQKYDETTTSYIGHIKSTSQRFYLPNDYGFKGILTLRFICGGFQYEEHGPDVPSITFTKTDTDEINQLTVVSASPADVYWIDLELQVDGTAADHGMSGTVTAGDMIDITSIAGTGAYTITIRHIPTNTLIGSWDFTAGTVTPTITFTQTDQSSTNTLTVVSVDPVDVLWSDIGLLVDGDARNHGNSGTVTAGDIIDLTSIAGTGEYTVSIIHIPTNTLLGIYEFTGAGISITFEQDEENHSLTVVAVVPDNIRWGDLRIEHEGFITGISDDGDGFVDVDESILSLYGLTEIYYEPTGQIIGTWIFPDPMIMFTQNEEDHSLIVIAVVPDDVRWDDLRIEDGDGFIVRPAHEFVTPGDIIFALDGLVQIYYIPTGRLIGEWEFP